ncbi:MAG TPA: zinc-dependent metalloprotease [Casimicrobiaceae bacterium]|nr:zinc-dependent metalloprotease [Casimicrobiaceae bacterium]
MKRMVFRLAASASVVVVALALGGCATTVKAPERAKSNGEASAIAEAAARAATSELSTPEAPQARSTNGPGSRPAPQPVAVAAAAAAQAAAQAAQRERPFNDVIKDAKEDAGLFRLWTREDRVWIEIAPDQFGKPFFLTSNLNRGIGENRLFGGMMTYPAGLSQIVEFRKVGAAVQLLAKNVKYTAAQGTPESRAVAAGFSDSLLAAAPVVSQPHPERKSILIDAASLFITDLPAAALVLERAYRQSYAFDSRNSTFQKARSTDDMATFDVNAHYSLARPSSSAAGPTLPSTLPDVRSLFLGFHYTIAKLPATPMRTRLADERIGYFTAERFDFTSDMPRVPLQRFVTRWRLEKQDPTAALSEPKQPIVYWLDRNIPVRYRDAVRDGILEWNKAFERIGFKNAIKVEVQPDDADFDTSDLKHASVRWQTVARTSYGAIGPTVVDPRTGEILDADIGIDANNVRVVRNLKAEYVPRVALPSVATGSDAFSMGRDKLYCTYDEVATGEAIFGLSLLEARGDLDVDGSDAERFVIAFLKDTVMHEVGHTLGLRHNFRASTIYTEAQLGDPAFTREHGISGSVMEYNPWNIALRGAKQGDYQMSTLGPYDYWAIEYGYREIAPEEETATLAAIAGRSHEANLAFATDEDASFLSLDPQINQLDLGQEPLAYAQKRFSLVRELWQRTEGRTLPAGERYSLLRRNFSRGLSEAAQGAIYAAKYIGGLTTLRDRAGSGRDPLTPVPVEKQREALQLIAEQVFSADSFRFSPAFLRRMSVSAFDIDDAVELGRSVPTVDIAVDQQVLAMQRSVLSQLLGETVAQRLVNNEAKVDQPSQALRLSELYATLHGAVWSELNGKVPKDIPLMRRNLQREYVMRLANVLVRPAATLPADARSLMRADATTLRAEIAKVKDRKELSTEARAHLAESLALIDEALRAPLVRQAV